MHSDWLFIPAEVRTDKTLGNPSSATSSAPVPPITLLNFECVHPSTFSKFDSTSYGYASTATLLFVWPFSRLLSTLS
jgi:hypothetical protein